MKLGPESLTRYFKLSAFIVLLILLPPSASAQKSAPPPPPPPKKSAPAPAPSHPAPAPAPHPVSHDNSGHPGGAQRRQNGKRKLRKAEIARWDTKPTIRQIITPSTGPNSGGNRTTGSAGNANRTNTNANNRNSRTPAAKPAQPENETIVRDITPNSASGKSGANSKVNWKFSAGKREDGLGRPSQQERSECKSRQQSTRNTSAAQRWLEDGKGQRQRGGKEQGRKSYRRDHSERRDRKV